MTPSPTAPSPRQFTLPAIHHSAPAFSTLEPLASSTTFASTPQLAHPHPTHARTHSLPHWTLISHNNQHETLHSSAAASTSAHPPSVARFASWPPAQAHAQWAVRTRGAPEPRPETLAAMYQTLAARWGETAKWIEDGRMGRTKAGAGVGMKRARGAEVEEGGLEAQESPAKVVKVEALVEGPVAKGVVEESVRKIERPTSPEATPRRSARQAIRHPLTSATRTPVSDCRGSRTSPSPPKLVSTRIGLGVAGVSEFADGPTGAPPVPLSPPATRAIESSAPTPLLLGTDLVTSPKPTQSQLAPTPTPASPPTTDGATASAPPLTPARSAALLAVVKSFEAVLDCRANSWRRMLAYERVHQASGRAAVAAGYWSA